MGTQGRADTAWVDHAIWWHVYPLGFVGAEPAGAPDATGPVRHRLAHLEAWLDYVVELGASGLALGPVFASSTHGYDTVDHFRIDPRLGDRADFDHLVAQAHARGLRVLLDGVFNHVGRAHPAFARVLAEGPDAADADLFDLTWAPGAQPGDEPGYRDFEGHHALVALDHTRARVADLVTDVMTYWLDAGADGWRLDAAYAVPRTFWADVLDRVRERHPDVYVLGEVIHGDYAGYVREGHLDSVTQYELWKSVWSSLASRNFFELAWTLSRHDELLDTFVPYTFVGNHDVTRLATALGGDRTLIAHALVVLFTVGGTPAVYAGDEQAFEGLKEERAGGDDAIRPAFPATPAGLAPDGWPVYRLHQELIGLRRRNPWLHRGRVRVLTTENERLLYEVTADATGGGEVTGGGHTLLVALNLAPTPWAVHLPTPSVPLAPAPAATATPPTSTVDLPPGGWAILSPTPHPHVNS